MPIYTIGFIYLFLLKKYKIGSYIPNIYHKTNTLEQKLFMSFSKLFRRKSTTTILQQGIDIEHSGLHKVLTVRDLTFFGIAAIIGGGTFSAIGNACFSGGPGVV